MASIHTLLETNNFYYLAPTAGFNLVALLLDGESRREWLRRCDIRKPVARKPRGSVKGSVPQLSTEERSCGRGKRLEVRIQPLCEGVSE